MYEVFKSIDVSPGLQAVIGVVAITGLTFIAAYVVRVFLFVVAKQVVGQTGNDLDDRLLRASRKHIYFLVYVLGGFALFNYLERVAAGTAEGAFRWMDGIMYTIFVFLVASLITRLAGTILKWYGETIAARTDTAVDDEFIPLADRAVKFVTYLLTFLIILDHFQVDIKGLIAVLGIGSLAVALAAQDTIANMIGGFVIMIDRPFRKGDRIRLDDGTICVVHAIGIRSTKFWTFDNTLIIVPNDDLMKSTVHNITYPFPQVRVVIDVGVAYDSDLDRVRDAMIGEASRHEAVLEDPRPSFFFLGFGDSALNVSMRCFVDDVADQFRTGSELREQVLNRFRVEGIEIPFPQRVVTMVGGERVPPPRKRAKARSSKPHSPRQPESPVGQPSGEDTQEGGGNGSGAQG